ncbi:type I restriction enzyme S subunit [Chryseobacterium sp. SORGH_AS 447]|uniref:restriction endonuclease subunit S n=1 Tax=Chryseobacterium sp. SORGH_AS_0447 TaxID=3041769 RepID=UPI0027876119|nr:restriction endonuclease subunit S [Chryseobacterium sp. SORGH_AS_0447]MDQ1161356.1 type I restriction enzyme S subunit [Chryseobacterium sp. SORGH_AS_0447]
MDTKKLRQKILDLAIRGKLVPQDPNDEPASVLIEKIRAEKEQLIKEKKIKRDKNESYIYCSDKSYYEKFADGTVKCIDDHIPFEIPESWEWCRLGSVVSLISGQDFPPDKYNSNEDGIPYIIGASNIFDGKLQINRWTTTPSVFAGKGDLLLVCKGAGVGKMCLCDLPKAHIARQIQSIRVYNNHISIEYIKQVLDCRIEDITSKANGLIPGLNRELILNFFIPIPPVDEQKKINQNIISSFELINSINRNKLDLSKIINQAKSKILDLAIRGKLVPQDPNDEPASVLLERIKAEHPESKKKAKYTRDNSHYPFEIPKSWEWSTIGEISQHNTGKTLHKGRNSGTPYQYITTSNLYWDSFVLDNLKEMPFEERELDKFSAIKGDLLICEGGDGGRSAIWTEEYAICFQNHIHRVRPFCDIKSKYIYFFMLYSSLKGSINDYKKGIGIQSLSSSSLASIRLSLPPIEEQKRIVKKIEDIFASLNEIANSIKA